MHKLALDIVNKLTHEIILQSAHSGYSLENSDGFTRHNFDATISPRDLTETYYAPFEMCLSAQPEQIMCSYNSVNGIPACLDGKAQNGFLRGELGFEGLIVSDCDAIGDAYDSHHYVKTAADAAADGIKAGCDQVRVRHPLSIRTWVSCSSDYRVKFDSMQQHPCTTLTRSSTRLLFLSHIHASEHEQDCGSTYKADNLRTAITSGSLTEADIDVALGRAMRMRMRAGMFDPPSRVPSVAHRSCP